MFLSLFWLKPASAQQNDNAGLAQVEWLAGKWERLNTRPGRTAFEVWEKKDWGYTGMGYTLQGIDTVFVERLSIRSRDGELWYVADVSQNVEPTWFKFTETSESGFVCENPDHDFPKRIEYIMGDGDNMQAIISGDGQSVTFSFRKVRYKESPDGK